MTQQITEKIDVFNELTRIVGLNKKSPISLLWEEQITECILLKHLLGCNSGDITDSPMHTIASMLTDDEIDSTDTVNSAESYMKQIEVANITIAIPILTPAYMAVTLPKNRNSLLFAQIYFAILRVALKKVGMDSTAKLPCFLIEVASGRKKSYKVVRIDAIDDADDQAIFNGFATNICTDNESEFDLEIEIFKMKHLSNENRSRIRERMKSLGVKVLKGRKADAILRNRGSRSSIDVALLAEKYPEAYAACVKRKYSRESLTIKIHTQGDGVAKPN